jgi:hypothetical protein
LSSTLIPRPLIIDPLNGQSGITAPGESGFKGNKGVRMIFNKSQYLKPNRNRGFSKCGHSFDSAVLSFLPAGRQGFFLLHKQKKEEK